MSLMSPTSPLEIPGLLRRISHFVTTKDAVACAQVSKTWSNHFTSTIWHSIDFCIHKKLLKTDTKAFTRYGHHIRVVKNISTHHHILVLLLSNTSKLKRLSIMMTASQKYYAHVSDLLRRINTTIEHIEIRQPTNDQVPFFPVDCLFPVSDSKATSRLSSLEIKGLTMTRSAFSSLLRNCPSLHTIEIRDSTMATLPTFDRPHPDGDYYPHQGVAELAAGFGQVFCTKGAPSLLAHFPNLISWETWAFPAPSESSVDKLKSEVTSYCPILRELWTRDPAPMASSMIAQAFKNLKTIGVEQDKLSAELVMAILHHEDTLEIFCTFRDEDILDGLDMAPMDESNPLEAGWIIQSIPRLCTRLKELELPCYEMSMSDIEKSKWVCHNLSSLCIRVQGLNTKEKIDRTIQLWNDGRRLREDIRSDGEKQNIGIPASDNSIEARFARHLLKFEKLKKVWIGWKVRRAT
ncbi:MAG: hypothetical protein J3Q66DRAFT_321555 [Benniella sp.]|nr:MAG: hypothetical protein J3Q66DRAFT_321555 [Benniella sp.]